jgi:hypothetical protein
MRSICLALLVLSFCNTLSAQVLKGTIKNVSGEPLPYSTVYIRELQQGTTSNTKGNYEIRLPEGKYTVIFQSLGFAPDIREITLGKNIVNLNIVLQVQYYEIPEIRITASGEDPAYGIMRKVIGLAPYYLNQVSHYKAEVYLKGNLVINKIPKILQKTIAIEARRESGSSANSNTMKQGDSYLMESVNELEFNAPDKYAQRVLSFQSTFPDQGNEISPMDFIQASFYQPVLAEMAISPLSPEALSHYKFKYLGSSPQGNFIVNKIQVIPKRKSQQLFEGTIFVIEDLWCLHSVDLVNENIAGKIRIQQLFIPVQDDIWMPVSHKFEIEISIIGFKADAGYGSSIKYNNVSPNTALKKPQNISIFSSGKVVAQDNNTDTIKTKTRKQIEKILAKPELTNRDMMKLSGLMEKESKGSQIDSAKKSLEVKEKVTHVVEKDAAKKDSTYWSEIRPIPLSETEYKSLRVSDSIKTRLNLRVQKSDTAKGDNKEKSKFIRALREIGSGHTWSDTSGLSFNFRGLVKLGGLSFNTVDGFTYGTDFRITKTGKNGNSLSFYPALRYAFSRQQLMWRLNIQYRFDRMDQRQVYLRTGITSMDINNNGGIDAFANSLTSLFLRRNYMKLYESSYLTTGFRTEISNGLYGDISASFEDRRLLSNTTNFSFIKSSREYTENVPDNPFLKNASGPLNIMQSQRHLNLTGTITYTPRQRYRIRGEIKVPLGSEWPTFSLTWKHGINEFPESASPWKHFDIIRFGASKSKEIGAFGELYWNIRSGGFLNNSNVPFFDYFNFSTQQLPILLNNYRDAFMLPDYYSLSTSEFFTEGHLKYTSPYLLLKLLPGISNTLIRENLSCSLLWSRYQKCYTEIGYALSEIFFMGEIGVYAGFDNFSYRSVGAKLVLKIN